MRYGFTSGSCAAAASKAAVAMLLSGRRLEKIGIVTPKGLRYEAKLVDIAMSEKQVSCAVIKDGGDDPDITSGAHIVSRVSFLESDCEQDKSKYAKSVRADYEDENGRFSIYLRGGQGVGIVTRPGLDQPVGNSAINHVPRQMILSEVKEVCEISDFTGCLEIVIEVPEGEELAKKTFNPRLGIEGGISILGTSGIVEPMSTQAILDTIRVELRQKKEMGFERIVISPGNYGMDFMKNTYDYDLNESVKCSNFIGATLDMCRELGFKELLLVGHIGKLVKLSGGIMNTHSMEADCRMELLAAAALLAGASGGIARDILRCLTTEEGIGKILEHDDMNRTMLNKTMEIIMDKALFYLRKRAGEAMLVECIMYSNEYGYLAGSQRAVPMLRELV